MNELTFTDQSFRTFYTFHSSYYFSPSFAFDPSLHWNQSHYTHSHTCTHITHHHICIHTYSNLVLNVSHHSKHIKHTAIEQRKSLRFQTPSSSHRSTSQTYHKYCTYIVYRLILGESFDNIQSFAVVHSPLKLKNKHNTYKLIVLSFLCVCMSVCL